MSKDRTIIDFVIAWVDGSDPEWLLRKHARTGTGGVDDRIERYRDWDLLRFWFRGVEKYAPWVRKIHFITDQKPPAWLNQKDSKLHVVYHDEYIPSEYLPVFNSHPIELNVHRIPGLARQFVFFCDDMFLIRPVKETMFFRKGLPVDCAGLNPLPSSALAGGSSDKKIFYIPLNDTEYLNREYSFRECLKEHPFKWFNLKYGDHLIRNLFFSSYSRFVGFSVFHLGQPYLIEAFEDAWKKNRDILNQTCSHPFRDDHDISQSFIRYRQLAEGNFFPGKPIRHAAFHISEDNSRVCDIIRRQKLPMICLNDGEIRSDSFERVKEELKSAFSVILPERSRFEL